MKNFMSSTIKFMGGALIVIVCLSLLFSIYCYLVTCITPFVYENFGMQKAVQESVVEIEQTKETKNIPIYSDGYNNKRIGVLGTFGDSSGFMNAFFSLLAFTAVALTFYYQFCRDRKDKLLTKKSEFESVFFNMASTLEDIVTHLEYHDAGNQDNLYSSVVIKELYKDETNTTSTESDSEKERVCYGREIFSYLYYKKLFTLDTGQQIAGIKGFIDENEKMTGSEIQEKVFDGSLDHYFRYAYRILKYIDTSDLIDHHDKKEFAAILRAQFSCYELILIFINCIEIDNNKFKHLVEKYCMFNNIRIELLPKQYQDVYLDKVNQGKERDGYEDNADSEYSITAFCKKD